MKSLTLGMGLTRMFDSGEFISVHYCGHIFLRETSKISTQLINSAGGPTWTSNMAVSATTLSHQANGFRGAYVIAIASCFGTRSRLKRLRLRTMKYRQRLLKLRTRYTCFERNGFPRTESLAHDLRLRYIQWNYSYESDSVISRTITHQDLNNLKLTTRKQKFHQMDS